MGLAPASQHFCGGRSLLYGVTWIPVGAARYIVPSSRHRSLQRCVDFTPAGHSARRRLAHSLIPSKPFRMNTYRYLQKCMKTKDLLET